MRGERIASRLLLLLSLGLGKSRVEGFMVRFAFQGGEFNGAANEDWCQMLNSIAYYTCRISASYS